MTITPTYRPRDCADWAATLREWATAAEVPIRERDLLIFAGQSATSGQARSIEHWLDLLRDYGSQQATAERRQLDHDRDIGRGRIES